MKLHILVLGFLSQPIFAKTNTALPVQAAPALSAEQILVAIDQNTFSESVEATSSMIVHADRKSRTMKAQSWTSGADSSFTEFLAPAREKGVKMLKLKGDLWTYYPDADRIIKIAGHMLRQSVMGSDLSYEDMMEDRRLVDLYAGSIVGEEKIGDRPCVILKLQAKTENVAYQSRKMWVDKERMLPLKEELYAKSGKLLKVIEVKKVEQRQSRWVPVHVVYKDQLQRGEGTELLIHDIKFNVAIPASRFQKSALRR